MFIVYGISLNTVIVRIVGCYMNEYKKKILKEYMK